MTSTQASQRQGSKLSQKHMRCVRSEQGSGTVAAFGALMGILCVGIMVVAGVHIYAMKAKVDAVADISALAGATHSSIELWIPPHPKACDVATEVAHRNKVTMRSCHTRDGDIYVHIEKSSVFFGVPVLLQARARAGPAFIPNAHKTPTHTNKEQNFQENTSLP